MVLTGIATRQQQGEQPPPPNVFSNYPSLNDGALEGGRLSVAQLLTVFGVAVPPSGLVCP